MRSLPPLPEVRERTVRGLRVAYRDVGPPLGRAVVALHGLGSSSASFAMNVPDLERERRAILIDLPGFGRSDKPSPPLGLRAQATVVLELLHALGVREPVWLGHSMGGQIALWAALLSPERVRGLLLVAPAGLERFSPLSASTLRMSVTERWVLSQHTRAAVHANLKLGFGRGGVPPAADLLVEERLRLAGGELRQFATSFVGSVRAMLAEPVHAELERVEAPVSILMGLDDRLIPNRMLHPHLSTRGVARSAARRFPRATLELVPGAGHLLHFERPDAVAHALDALDRAVPR